MACCESTSASHSDYVRGLLDIPDSPALAYYSIGIFLEQSTSIATSENVLDHLLGRAQPSFAEMPCGSESPTLAAVAARVQTPIVRTATPPLVGPN